MRNRGVTAGTILEAIRRRTRKTYESLDQAWTETPNNVWNVLYDLAYSRTASWTPESVAEFVEGPLERNPHSALGVLLRIALMSETLHDELVKRFVAHLKNHPRDGLRAAASALKMGPKFHDARLIAAAREHYALDPEAAWWVFVYAARLAPRLLDDELLRWLDERHAAGGSHWYEILAERAREGSPLAEWALTRYRETFSENPGDAVEAAAQNLAGERGEAPVRIVEDVRRHFDARPEKAWDFFVRTSHHRPELVTPVHVDFLVERFETGPAQLFKILHNLAARDEGRASSLVRRFAELLPRHPKEGVDESYYLAHNDTKTLRQELVDAVSDHFAASAYHAYDVLRHALERRPELIQRCHVEAAVGAIPLATNWAFGFFKELLERRPEFKPLAVTALFDALAIEPVNRAHNRVDMIRSIKAVAQASHVETELGRLLSEPPGVGSRRARALMAIMFRQTSHAKQNVLFEALGFFATGCTWSDRNWTPLWDFLLFLIDHSSDDAVSTAAAERFLEGAYQLHYLMERGADHDAFRAKFDVRSPASVPWPEGARCLEADTDLTALRNAVLGVAGRLGRDVRLKPLEEFAGRQETARKELEALERKIAGSDPTQRERLERRREALKNRLATWKRPEFASALDGNLEAERALTADDRKSLAREKKDLAKRLRDALRAELEEAAVEAVEGTRMGLYQAKLKGVLGRDVDIRTVDSRILPSFLFFPSLGNFPNNRKYLARLIEDRIENRPHDWLRTEPDAAAWAETVRKKRPGIRLDEWRKPFTKSYDYRPASVREERNRRIRDDLAQARTNLERAGATGIAKGDLAELLEKLNELRTLARQPPREDGPGEKKETPKIDATLLEEAAMDLERVRIEQETPESDFKGRLTFEIETDPFEVLFMGEYGFASCLSLRGMHVWSAVSNAIDVDKAIVWAKEPNGNVVGRRLLALLPEGLLSYRTYTNRHGLALDPMFHDFIASLAKHLGTEVVHHGRPGPLLSDRWYDDGSV